MRPPRIVSPLPRDLRPGRAVELRAHASWVVCRVDCIAEDADLARRVGAVAGPGTRDERWSASLRIAPPSDWTRPMDSVLFLSATGGVIRHAAAQPFAAASAAAAGSLDPGASLPFWLVLGLAFAGGILLNLMPCVFPVVSLKVLGCTVKY